MIDIWATADEEAEYAYHLALNKDPLEKLANATDEEIDAFSRYISGTETFIIEEIPA